MKKVILAIMIASMLSLSACEGDTAANVEPAQSTATEVQAPVAETPLPASGETVLNTSYENAVSIESQLLLGTFLLEGTDLAVTAEQAAALLPLWSEMQSIAQSMPGQDGTQGQGGAPGQGSAPEMNATPGDMPEQSGTPGANTEIQEHMDAVTNQIIDVMTDEQIAAISTMQITQETAITTMEGLGLGMQGGPGSQQPGGGQMIQGTPPADMQVPQQGTPPAGMQGGPGSGQQPGGGQQMPPAMGGGMMLSTQLIDALLELLTTRSGG